mmetsp:Transcript_8372/g.26179  ORF Transcript_8372/g.26179 Transcript_8372/m.26179 type:complete len:139 (-) Transcript_8372:1329-1745(-)
MHVLSNSKLLYRRFAVGTADNQAHARAQCDHIETKDEEAQFACGNDDTDFENLVAMISHRRPRTRADPEAIEFWSDGNSHRAHLQRLPAVIRNVCPITEALIQRVNEKLDISQPEPHSVDALFEPAPWTRIDKLSQSS